MQVQPNIQDDKKIYGWCNEDIMWVYSNTKEGCTHTHTGKIQTKINIKAYRLKECVQVSNCYPLVIIFCLIFYQEYYVLCLRTNRLRNKSIH